MSNLPALGTKVRCKAYVLKFTDIERDNGFRSATSELKRYECEFEGVFVGHRTWSTGRTEKVVEVGEYGTTLGWEIDYRPNQYHAIWIVYFDKRQNPRYVFPEDCEVIE